MFRSPALASLRDKVVYWPPPLDDGHGEKQWILPYQCWGRFVDAIMLKGSLQEEMGMAYGSVVIDFFYIGAWPLVGGYVWKGCASELAHLDRPPLEDYDVAKKIVQVRPAQPLRDRLMTLAILKVK